MKIEQLFDPVHCDPDQPRDCIGPAITSNQTNDREVSMSNTGTVKFFNEQKGFGFITPADGADVFVHVSNIVGGATLTEGQTVEYEVGPGRKGPEAVNVKPV